MARMARDLRNSHTLCKSVNVAIKITINFYDMTTLHYLGIKEKFEYVWVLDNILYDWRLVRHYVEWVWVILGEWGLAKHYFWRVRADRGGCGIILGGWRWVGMSGALFWVVGGGWENILGEWGWVGGGGGEWEWIHCSIMPLCKITLVHYHVTC